MKKKEIVLVVVLVLMGLVHLAIKKGNFAVRFSDKWSPKKYALTEPDFPNKFIRAEKTFEDIKNIKLENTAGSVVVSSSDNEAVYLTSELTVYTEDKDKADKIQKSIKLYNTVDDGTLFISSYENQKFSPKRVRVKYILKVPDDISVELSNRFGDVTIHSTGASINSYNSRGNTTASDCSDANIFLSNKSGEIPAKAINGNLSINGRYSPALVKDIAGDLDIKLYYSDLNCSDISSGTLSAESKYAPVMLNNIKSEMTTVVSKKGEITINFAKEMKRLSIITNNANVNLNCPAEITPDLNADIDSGDITIEGFPKFSVDKGKERTVGVIPGDDTVITISGKYGDIFIKKQLPAKNKLPVKTY